MVRSKSVTFLCVTCSFAVALGACADDGPAIAEGCGDIGTGGCPGNSLETCADEACAFVASCSPTGVWVPRATCPARPRDAAADAMSDAGGFRDAATPSPVDAGSPSASCPPLQLPDCSEATRAACGSGCCGCEDLFRCEAAGWAYVGVCVP